MSDNDIIASIREGDREVESQTYQRYRTEFIRWAQKTYQCSEDDAKEVYQSAFLAFYTKVVTGNLALITSSIKSYLFGIGKNKIREHRRSGARFEYNIDEERTCDSDNDLRQKEDREAIYQRIEEAMQKLSEPQRQILIMVYYENRSMEYITEKLGYKNAASTKNQKYKCMERIRKMLETNKKID